MPKNFVCFVNVQDSHNSGILRRAVKKVVDECPAPPGDVRLCGMRM